MSELNESILQYVGWLAYLPVFPLPGILLGSVAALCAIFGCLRHMRDRRTDPVWSRGWVWASLAVVTVLVYVILGFGFAGDGSGSAAARIAAWWGGPIVVIFFCINEAVLSRRRILDTEREGTGTRPGGP